MDKLLRAAFITSNQQRICSAIDVAVHRYGISDLAREAGLDRTTLYRAFRLKNGPALSTMIRVLLVLGYRLAVRTKDRPNFHLKRSSGRKAELQAARATARSLTEAFRRCRPKPAIGALASALRAQNNVSELARRTIRSRGALYRAFAHPRDPRFFTVLSFVNALDLNFEILRRSSKSRSQK